MNLGDFSPPKTCKLQLSGVIRAEKVFPQQNHSTRLRSPFLKGTQMRSGRFHLLVSKAGICPAFFGASTALTLDCTCPMLTRDGKLTPSMALSLGTHSLHHGCHSLSRLKYLPCLCHLGWCNLIRSKRFASSLDRRSWTCTVNWAAREHLLGRSRHSSWSTWRGRVSCSDSSRHSCSDSGYRS